MHQMQSMPKRFTHECKHQTQSQDAEAGQDGKPIPDGPHSSTFSRARGKLDIFAMLARQWEWRQDGFESRWISLCDWLQTEGLVEASSAYLSEHSLIRERILPILVNMEAITMRRASLDCQGQKCETKVGDQKKTPSIKLMNPRIER